MNNFFYKNFLFVDLYLAIFCLRDNFYDIVFDLKIDIFTYDFTKEEYLNENPKIFWHLAYIISNAFVLLCFIYILIFILSPIIIFRVRNFWKKPVIRVTQQIGSTDVSLLKERFTNTTN